MEEKDFIWLCRTLVSAKARISVPETIFFQGEAVDLWVFTDESGVIRKRNTTDEPVKSPIDACKYFQARALLAASRLKAVCNVLSRLGRTAVDAVQAESIQERKELFMRLTGVQEFKESKGEGEWMHRYNIKFDAGHGYVSTFTKQRVGCPKEPETSARLIHKARDLAMVILRAVEELKMKRVLHLDFDLLIDPDNVLWVLQSDNCAIGLPGCAIPSETTVQVKEKPQQRQRKHTSLEAKTDMKLSGKLTFKRGQLRSIDSNLNSPLRILSPSYSPAEPRSPTGDALQAESGAFIDLTVKSLLPASKNKSFLVKQQSMRHFFNPNFQEMLILRYLKRQGVTKYKQATTLQDEFYRELDYVEATDSSPLRNARRQTQQKNESVTTSENRARDSSVSDGSPSLAIAEVQETAETALKLPLIIKKPAVKRTISKRQLYEKRMRHVLSLPLQPVLLAKRLESLSKVPVINSHPGRFPASDKL